MDNTQQRITIAEASGWCPHPDNGNRSISYMFWTKGGHAYGDTSCIAALESVDSIWPSKGSLPDYPNDLNACFEMEKYLTEEEWPKYRDIVRLIVLGPARVVSQFAKGDLHVSAAQRSEAFLKCKGLWK